MSKLWIHNAPFGATFSVGSQPYAAQWKIVIAHGIMMQTATTNLTVG